MDGYLISSLTENISYKERFKEKQKKESSEKFGSASNMLSSLQEWASRMNIFLAIKNTYSNNKFI